MSSSRLVRLAGILVLALGGVAAAIAFALAPGEDTRDVRDIPGLARSEARTLERLGGKATARTVAFDDWLASLWHGERLGWTLAVIALVAGGACLHVAGLMDEALPDDESRAPRA